MRTLLLSLTGICFVLLLFSCGNQTSSKKQTAPTDSTNTELEGINTRLRLNPRDANLYEERAKYYMGKKDYNAALADMKRALDVDSSKSEYYLTLADLYFFMNKTANSKQALEKCVAMDPKNVEGLTKLAELYFYVRKYEKSLSLLDDVLKADPYNSKAYFMKGMNFKEAGDTLKAISSMQTAVEQDNSYYNAYIQLGILFAAKHNQLAEGYYQNAIRIQPNNPEVLYDFARYYQDIGNYKEATTLYNQLLAVSPNNFDVQFNLGVIEVALKSYEEAMKYFNEAIRIQPKDPRGYYGRGLCFQKKGNVQNAAADYRYTLTLDPEFELAKKGLKEMKIY